jgi:hypothetical protein
MECTKDLFPENVILTDEGGKDLVLRRKTLVFQQRDPHLSCGGARVAFGFPGGDPSGRMTGFPTDLSCTPQNEND